LSPSLNAKPRIAVRIQHHPSRAELLPDLIRRLDGLPDVEVVTDPGGKRPDPWRCYRLCLRAMPDRATHLLVIQDDALPVDEFADRCRRAVEARPRDMLALFVPGFGFMLRRLRADAKDGEPFVPLPRAAFVPVVALVIPRLHVEGLLAFTDPESWPTPRLGTADDAILEAYRRQAKAQIMATVPCLVDHDDGVPSIAKPAHRPGPHRRAALL
jgi:hypothetical protein